MSETTATRMGVAARVATLTVLAGLWLAAAWALWRTHVPGDLRLPRLDPHRYFSAALLRRTAHHDRFLRVDFLLASAAQLVALTLLAVRAPRLIGRLRGGPILRGLELALAALIVSWVARLPFGLAAEWWDRRYGLERQSYGAWLLGRLPSPASVATLLVLVALGMLLARRLGRRWWLAAGPPLAAGGLARAPSASPAAASGAAASRGRRRFPPAAAPPSASSAARCRSAAPSHAATRRRGTGRRSRRRTTPPRRAGSSRTSPASTSSNPTRPAGRSSCSTTTQRSCNGSRWPRPGPRGGASAAAPAGRPPAAGRSRRRWPTSTRPAP